MGICCTNEKPKKVRSPINQEKDENISLKHLKTDNNKEKPNSNENKTGIIKENENKVNNNPLIPPLENGNNNNIESNNQKEENLNTGINIDAEKNDKNNQDINNHLETGFEKNNLKRSISNNPEDNSEKNKYQNNAINGNAKENNGELELNVPILDMHEFESNPSKISTNKQNDEEPNKNDLSGLFVPQLNILKVDNPD